jgi:CDGSH-type Zn-finger protein/uncharacterized Fe-S cluster protein YjdI
MRRTAVTSISEPKIRIDTREELIYLLAEATAIEHNLMCCYLYAAWSLKRGERDGLTKEQTEAVERWRRAITLVAVEEMSHLALACNLTAAIGAGPHLSRPNFPIPPGYHPSGVVAELAGFSPATLDHFIFLERPEGKELTDSSEFVHPAEYHRTLPKGRLMPSAQDYATVGHLYRGIRHGLISLAHHIGEKALFVGDPAAQITPSEASLPGLIVVTDLKTADQAIETIIEQGEGAPGHNDDSHFNRFLQIRHEYDAFIARDPSFKPAFPVAHNPTMRAPIDPHNRVHINEPEAARILDLANSLYGHMLRSLVQAFGRGSGDEAGRRLFVNAAIDLMFLLPPIGQHLASLPANTAHPGVHAGVTFTMLRDIARLPRGPGEKRVMAERIGELARHARHVFPEGHELAGTAAGLDKICATFTAAIAAGDPADAAAAKVAPAPGQPIVPAGVPTAQPRPPQKPQDVPSGSGMNRVEVADGKDLRIRFYGKRCIHARHCVLLTPTVFKANTPGEWIFPDAMDTEAVVRVAYVCPSGAIQYDRKDGGPQEHQPPVNVMNLRENGPYAIRAPMTLAGESIGFRATLCRCGASKHKPFCDGSHNAVGFTATGEPETRNTQSLAVRDGPLSLEPQKNGPLVVSGNLEICSGTGRVVDRVTKARLCRCGGSRTKPFCDNTHLRNGFQADGV